MLSYCLKCKKMQRVKTQRLQRQETDEYYLNHTVRFAIVENQDLSKSKKLVGL